MFRDCLAVAAVTIGLAGPGSAQTFPAAAQRAFSELQAAVPVADGGVSQQVQLRLSPSVPGLASNAPAVAVVARLRGLGALPRQRDPQLAPDRLVVVSVDSAGREVDWRIIADPRRLRAEVADDQGRLSNAGAFQTGADLFIDIPDAPDIVGVRMYEPVWVEGAYVLRLLVSADLR